MRATERKVITLIATKLGVSEESVLRASNLERDCGADSLDLVELLILIEDEFGIEIPDEEAEELATVQQLIDYIESRVDMRRETSRVQQSSWG